MIRSNLFAIVVAGVGLPLSNAVAQGTPEACPITPADHAWLQKGLTSWELAGTEFLRLEPAPLPWIVVFDEVCTWHLASDTLRTAHATPIPAVLHFNDQPVPIRSEVNHGMIRLPTGDSFPAQPRISAGFSADLGRPYFILALPRVFRRDPGAARDTLLDQRILSVVSHEILHTRQLPDLFRQVQSLGRQGPLPEGIDDNIVERQFGSIEEFRASVDREIDLLYSAAFEADPLRARALAGDALKALRERQAKYYTADHQAFGRLEALFLNMEGASEWVRYRLHQRDRERWPTDQSIVRFIRGGDNEWVQDQGLALFLVIDRFVKDWPSRLLTPEMASPVEVLEQALAG